MLMGIMKRSIALFIVLCFMSPLVFSANVHAEVVTELKTGFPDQEVFTPGEWFLGQKPANYDEIKHQFSSYKEEMVMRIVGMERQYIMR